MWELYVTKIPLFYRGIFGYAEGNRHYSVAQKHTLGYPRYLVIIDTNEDSNYNVIPGDVRRCAGEQHAMEGQRPGHCRV